jgi:hypothetical protein
MKLSIYTLSMLAAFAVGGSALAATATTNGPAAAGTADMTGMASLGVDISAAGTTPDSVATFVGGLSTDQQSGVKNGCQSIVANPTAASPNVLGFCKNLNGGN